MDLAQKLDHLKQAGSEALLRQLGGRLMRGSDLLNRPPVKTLQAFNTDTINPADSVLSENGVSHATQLSVISQLFPEAEIIECAGGALLRRVIEFAPFDAQHPRGYAPPDFADTQWADALTISRLARDEAAAIPLERWAFIDTETTGLAGGTGTYVFLTGIGSFSADGFRLEQYFMPDFCAEPALIEALERRLRDFEGIVSYNGRAFDLPLLRSRFIFNRRRPPGDMPHWDLLGPARRLWKKTIGSCALGNVERMVLGLPPRENDVPGCLIPQIYFDYLRGAPPDALRPVFDHHAQDVLSLAGLALRCCRLLRNPTLDEIQHAGVFTGLAKIFERHGERQRALDCLENALLLERDPAAIFKLSMRLAKRYKRLERWNDALEIWRAQLDGAEFFSIEPFVELAKYYEHRARDCAQALSLVERALGEISRREQLGQYLGHPNGEAPNYEPWLKALKHRRIRLRCKTPSMNNPI